MSSIKSVGAHVLTALVTFALVLLWVGERGDRSRPSPVAQIRRGQGLAARPVEAAPAPPPGPLPEELLKTFDADEQINIRVYANANRSVVNITTASSVVGLFGDESTT